MAGAERRSRNSERKVCSCLGKVFFQNRKGAKVDGEMVGVGGE